MELDQIIQMLNGKTEIKLVKFISDKGPNSCEACLKYHGEIFRLDDSNKPELPIHPHCRCKYELLTPNEVCLISGRSAKNQNTAHQLGKPDRCPSDSTIGRMRRRDKSSYRNTNFQCRSDCTARCLSNNEGD